MASQGAAVLLSSHILAEVEKLCDTVTIVRAGRTVRSGTLADMRHLMRTTITLRTRGDGSRLEHAPYVHDLRHDDGRLSFSVDRDDLGSAMADLSSLDLDELSVAPASLEDMFLREYAGAATENGRR